MISINHMDCMDLMATMEEGTVDLIVTDPPYLFKSLSGGGIANKRTTSNHSIRWMRESGMSS